MAPIVLSDAELLRQKHGVSKYKCIVFTAVTFHSEDR